MSVEVGVGYVSVVPEMRGFGRMITQQMNGPAAQAGQAAGRHSGRGFLSGVGGAVKGGVAAVAAGAGALFAAGFVKAVEQDKANAKLSAQLGLSEKESARLGKVAGKVYAAGYGESIDQVNDSLRALAQNGVASLAAPKRALAGLSKAALNLAETFEVDVSDSARAAGQLIRTGMVKDAREAFDLITRGFQLGADKAGDLLDTLNEYSTQFRDLGLTGKQSVGLLTQGLAAGARDADIVADALKEFAIRAKDGSDTTKEGFDAIGLSADKMATTFAKGGPGAARALDTILDRLRAIEDPAKRSQTAILLFGTQAEDLQKSLFALDPSKAEGALGRVGGAADKMGKTLHNTATRPIEVFKRQALQGLATFSDKYALPALLRLGGFLNRYVLPPARTAGGTLVDVLVPAVKGTGEALASGVRWVKEYGAWLIPLGVAVAGLTLTMGASAIATGATIAVFSVYRGVTLAATAATRGFAVAQGLANAAMRANPIGLILTGVAALATLLVIAYNKSDRFRKIVQATWSGIKAGWDVLWNSALKPGLGYLMTGLRAVGSAASWLWSTVLSPVFSAIGIAAKVLVAIVVTAVVAPIVIAFRAFGAVASWLWSAAIAPAFRGIGSVALWLYESGLRPVASGGVASLRALGAAGSWLWRSALSPAFRGIGAVATWLYESAIKPAMQLGGASLRALGAAGSWVYRSVIKPALEGIGATASWLYAKALKPALDSGKQALGLFGGAFDTAKEAIDKAWGQVQKIAAEPVNFIIEWVYTKGIKAVWDKVAGFVGLDKLPAAPKLLAAGGTVGPWGPAEPMKVNRPTAIVGEGNPRHPEYVIPTDPKYRGRARSLWRAAGTQLMADGGILGDITGWVGDKAKKIGGVIMDGAGLVSEPSKMWEKATGFVRSKIKEIGSSKWARVLAKLPLKMLSGLKDKLVDAASSFLTRGTSGLAKIAANIGGSGVKRWTPVVLQALNMVGQPASLLPVVLRRMNQESGGNPRAINNWDINARRGTPSKGLMQVIDPTFSAYAGKLRGRGVWDPLANLYASMRYALATYGSLSRAYNRPGGYADGGRPRPGEIAWVGEEGPELVRFGSGRSVVWDSPTSLRMAAGHGLRGFAKGTSNAKAARAARRDIPGDLTSFSKSLTGAAADISQAARSLADDLRKTGGAGRKLAVQTLAASAKLQALAKRRDSVSGRLAVARQAYADQKKSAGDYMSLSNISSPTSVGDLIGGLKTRQASVATFESQIKTAQKKGVDQRLIQQLVAAGPDSDLARLVSGANSGQIKELNALAKSGAKLSDRYGRTMADAMYDAGSQAGRGFLTGLKAQEAELQKQMNKLGAGLVKAIKRELKIKSPSRVTGEVGAQVGAGLVGGMVSTLPQIDRAAVRMAAAAVPVPVTSGPAGAPVGLQDGQQIALVLADGTQLDAYVDARVDAGLTTARQRSRAGVKGR